MSKRVKSIELRRQRDARTASRSRPVPRDEAAAEVLRKLLEAGRAKSSYLRKRAAKTDAMPR